MTYPITDIAGIEEDAAAALKKAGIRTTRRLLDSAARPKDRKNLALKTGLPEKSILCWANMADRDRKSTRLNSSHIPLSRMPSSA